MKAGLVGFGYKRVQVLLTRHDVIGWKVDSRLLCRIDYDLCGLRILDAIRLKSYGHVLSVFKKR